ncbi:MAG: hypothetical protein JOZ90_11220 [Alphaproteobacteria bacterium]|nr:hypothetical protein [Alphaproteobacteria bacterium]MBV9372233.1 hypothetical protein [Alphaproteobacteria bacterium]MBV9901656.1 hypothetical protein [Alphaproteobacteria bacterium]
MDVSGETGVRPKRSLASALVLPLVAFLLGLAAMAWLLMHWSAPARWLGLAPSAPAVAAAPAQPQPVVSVEPEPPAEPQGAPTGTERLVIDPETTRRVNRLEERLGQIELQSRAATGNADRAEALLVSFAARRALDRGVALGYIEALLRQRFAAAQPQAVATVLTAARDPVTLQKLQSEFQDVAMHLGGGGPDQSWWQAFRTELGGLVTIRRENTPSTLPSERLKRAQQALDSGLVEVALVEVLRLPGRQNAAGWIAKARRYVAARQALDTLETAALIDPAAGARPQPQPQPPPLQQPPQQPDVAAAAAAAPRR